MELPSQPGTYVLLMHLATAQILHVGALGPCLFEAGYYLYVGSAMGGLRQRVSRHARAAKRLHWHIDYLLAEAFLCEVWYHVGCERLECAWAQALTRVPQLGAYGAPLGASDCACRTHLFYARERPRAEVLRASFVDEMLLEVAPAAAPTAPSLPTTV